MLNLRDAESWWKRATPFKRTNIKALNSISCGAAWHNLSSSERAAVKLHLNEKGWF